MKTITLSCEIITPLFMGGAKQQAELRTQSFNGLFRYWFRLLGGSFEDEKRLFGWGGEEARKGIVNIIVKDKNYTSSQFQRRSSYHGYNYLGFFLALTRREGIKNGTFKISFKFYPEPTEEDIKKFLCAVWCAFYLGNFGSRSRRGFGSIVVKDINGDIPQSFNLRFKPEQNIENWLIEQLDYIRSLNYWQGRNNIPYIFENLAIYRLNEGSDDCIQILNKIGENYKDFRQNLRGDQWKNRIWFGLPVMPRAQGRRASPMSFKIIKSDNNYEGFILTFTPTEKHNFKFLPDETNNNGQIPVDTNWWQILCNFINELKANAEITQIYP